MTHRAEGDIQAFLDDQLVGQERAAMAEHLLVCAVCRSVHEELRRAKVFFSGSIGALDVEPPRATLPVRASRRLPPGTGSLAKAAVLVLLMAAAAAAVVPGSPIREWVGHALAPAAQPAPTVDASAPSPAQLAEGASRATVSVQGTVRSATGRALAFARVEVVADTLSGWSDEGGSYRLEGAPSDRWLIRATHPGYRTTEATVVLPARGQVALDLTLEAVPGPAPEPLADFQPFHVEYTLPALLNRDEVTAAIERSYPERFEGRPMERSAVLQLWLDEQGRVARSALSRSSGERELDRLALSVSRDMRFRPAMNRDEPVRVIVLMPVRFSVPAAQAGPADR
jgi:TonB family protein